MRSKRDRRHATWRQQSPARPAAGRVPDLRVATLPPAPPLQAAIALMYYSITHDSSSSKKSS
jgi:hypothetical protein